MCACIIDAGEHELLVGKGSDGGASSSPGLRSSSSSSCNSSSCRASSTASADAASRAAACIGLLATAGLEHAAADPGLAGSGSQKSLYNRCICSVYVCMDTYIHVCIRMMNDCWMGSDECLYMSIFFLS